MVGLERFRSPAISGARTSDTLTMTTKESKKNKYAKP